MSSLQILHSKRGGRSELLFGNFHVYYISTLYKNLLDTSVKKRKNPKLAHILKNVNQCDSLLHLNKESIHLYMTWSTIPNIPILCWLYSFKICRILCSLYVKFLKSLIKGIRIFMMKDQNSWQLLECLNLLESIEYI